MKNNNNKTFLTYGFFAILFISLLVYWDTSLERNDLPSLLPSELSEITMEKIFPIQQESLFNLMTDVKNYPYILPSNVIDIKIIERSENTIIAQEKLIERGIVIDLLVKHTFIPYETHVIEILDGDASGTKIEQTFEKFENNTLVKNKVTFNLNGILTPFKFLPENNAIHALETVLNQFETYEASSSDLTTKIIDDLYREILKRPVDQSGLEHYHNLLTSKQITSSELRELLINSDELKSLSLPYQMISIENLNSETVDSINELYQEVLLRDVDHDGLKHFGSLLENNKLTFEELKELLLKSDERIVYEKKILKTVIKIQFGDSERKIPFDKIYNHLDLSDFKKNSEINNDTVISLNSIFNEILDRPIDDKSLQYFGILLDSKQISLDDLRTLLSEDCVYNQVRPCTP
jgi:hypothetical protein